MHSLTLTHSLAHLECGVSVDCEEGVFPLGRAVHEDDWRHLGAAGEDRDEEENRVKEGMDNEILTLLSSGAEAAFDLSCPSGEVQHT